MRPFVEGGLLGAAVPMLLEHVRGGVPTMRGVRDMKEAYTRGCGRCNLERRASWGYRVAIPWGLHEKLCRRRYPKNPLRAHDFPRPGQGVHQCPRCPKMFPYRPGMFGRTMCSRCEAKMARECGRLWTRRR